jgi:type III restriction enzyme
LIWLTVASRKILPLYLVLRFSSHGGNGATSTTVDHADIRSTRDVDFKTVKPCFGTVRSHINLVAGDTATWEQTAAFRLEQAARKGIVGFYAKNDYMEFVIPYEYLGVSHAYTPDFLVRLANGSTLVLEIKGHEDDQDRAKHQAAKRWISAVNNWGEQGRWQFHVCKDPQMPERELAWLATKKSKVDIEFNSAK